MGHIARDLILVVFAVAAIVIVAAAVAAVVCRVIGRGGSRFAGLAGLLLLLGLGAFSRQQHAKRGRCLVRRCADVQP